MPTLFITRGLPASGKSTWAREHLASQPKGSVVIVCRDDLRLMLHNNVWSKHNEKATKAARDVLIRLNLLEGRDVICADTNLDSGTQEHLQNIAAQVEAEVEFVDFTDVPLRVCLDRDSRRENPVGSKVINRLYRQHIAKPYDANEDDGGLPAAIIVDVDGTLAHMTDRSPYDYGRVSEDVVDVDVARLVRLMHGSGTKVLIVSGRRSDCIEVTRQWLVDNDVPFDELWQREPGDDTRHDYLIKEELFRKHIEGRYSVRFVLDDRDQVVNMWRETLGLKVLQVAPGPF